MVAHEIINANIPTLKPTDSGQRALDFMEEFKVFHLPVIQDSNYLGIISEATLINAFDVFGPVSEFKLEFQTTFLSPGDYVFDITQAMFQNKLSVLPILNDQEKYEGVITLDNLLRAYGALSSVKSPGSVFELLLKTRDYSLTEISRIIESNGARVLSSFVRSYKNDPDQLLLSIKLDKELAPGVFAALERHNYNIVAKFGADEEQNNDIERLQHLFKYLDT